jgi:hypothetical protein
MSTVLLPPHAQLVIHHATGASSGGGGLSTGAIVAAVAAGLVILACLAWACARWWAYEPHWLPVARHASAEAGLRLSATWDELRDWMRLGH